MKYFLFLTLFFSSSIFSSEFNENLDKAIDGDIDAQFSIGMMYKLGKKIPRDIMSSNEWFERASKKGHAEAQFELAENLGMESFRTVSNPNVIKWLKLSSDGGINRAHLELGKSYVRGWYGLEVNKKLARKYISKAAIAYQKKAIDGIPEAEYLWGDFLSSGYGKYVDGYDFSDEALEREKGLRWILKSAKKGHVEAMHHAGAIYYSKTFSFGKSLVLQSNYQKAIQWLEKAAEKENADALELLSRMHENGEGLDVNRDKSFNLALKAAHLGNADAQYNVARKYLQADGVKKNIEKAYSWALIANHNGHYDISIQANGNWLRKKPAVDLIFELESHLTKNQIKSAKTLAEVCFESLYQKCQ